MSWLDPVFQSFGLYSWTTGILLTSVLSLFFRYYRNNSRSLLNYASGPPGWPLVGYLPFLFAEKPTQLMYRLKEKYGNVFSFYLGNRYCVVLSDYKSVREGFTKKVLQDRPSNYMRMSTVHKTLAELKGAEWEEQRMFFVKCLITLGVGRKQFEDSVMDELSRVIPRMERFADKPECNVRDVISGSINNSVFKIICGRWFEDEHQLMQDFLNFQTLLVESFSNNMPIIYFPWVDWFLTKFQPHMRAILKSAAIIEEFIRSEVSSHEKAHTGNSDNDYIDLFLKERKHRLLQNNVSTFTREQLIYNSMLFLLAGTDTVRNTLEWLFMSMAIFPDIQDKVHEEIDRVLGRERAPAYEDKSSLPYTEAVILESERWKTLVPLNVLREATKDTHIQGYFIPKGSVVMNNLENCHNDPEYWDSPRQFVPERFLSADKSRVIVPECFIPFSIGKRDCPGDKMANIEIFLYFVSLMQRFTFSPPDGGVDFAASHRMNLQALRPVVKVNAR